MDKKPRWSERKDRRIDPLEFFRKNYDSKTTRSRLVRSDSGLYKVLWRRDLLDLAIPNSDSQNLEKKSVRTIGRRFGDSALEYYQTHYSGKTRGALYRLDSYLYEMLVREGSLEKVPLKYEDKH